MKTCTIPWLSFMFNEARKESAIPCEVALAKGEVRRVNSGRQGVLIDCREGRVWVTQTGDSRDIILQRGERDKTSGQGLVLIESLDSAVIRIF